MDGRMYSAGYRAGQRLSAYPRAICQTAGRTDDPRLIALGNNDYVDGFEDGHGGAVPRSPLILSDTDNELMGARA